MNKFTIQGKTRKNGRMDSNLNYCWGETSPFPSRQIQVFQPREFKQRNKKWHTTKKLMV